MKKLITGASYLEQRASYQKYPGEPIGLELLCIFKNDPRDFLAQVGVCRDLCDGLGHRKGMEKAGRCLDYEVCVDNCSD